MAVISKDLAPFTYSGNWDINEYAAGMFVARLLSSGTLTPKSAFTGDVCIVDAGSSGGSSGSGGRGGAVANYYKLNINGSKTVTVGTNASKTSSFGGDTTSGLGASGGDAGTAATQAGTTVPQQGGTAGKSGTAGQYAFDGSPSYFASTRYGGGGGGGAGDMTDIKQLLYHYPGYGDDFTYYYTGTSLAAGSGGSGGGGSGAQAILGPINPTLGSANGNTGSSGSVNTGGGGGGGGAAFNYFNRNFYTWGAGGAGGSGIVLLRGSLNLNSPPTNPNGISYNVPQAGKPLSISTGGSTDADGDAVNYVWERRIDSGAYVQLGITSAPTINDTVPTSGNLYQVRVKAVDSKGNESGYTTGTAQSINYNNPPVITLETQELGERRGAFEVKFKVDDPDANDILNVSVLNDGVSFVRLENVARNKTLTVTLSYELWARAADGSHYITIAVDDSKTLVEKTIWWNKAISGIDIVMTEPVEMDEMPKRVLIVPDVTMAAGATQKYYACNNGFDPEDQVVWEDITSAALNGVAYAFTNDAKKAEKWGVRVRAVLTREPGTSIMLRRIDGVTS